MEKWESTTIGDLCKAGLAHLQTGPFGTQLKASEYTASGTPVINVRNIGMGSIKPDKLEHVSTPTRDRLSSHILNVGDIVFGRKGAVERHVFIRQEQNGWLQGSDCIRLRVSSRHIEPIFASYYFLTTSHQAWMMNQCSHGAIMASLNQAILERIELPLPPIPTQRRIASVLSAYDDLIENNTRRIGVLEEMARVLYRHWFSSPIIQSHWKRDCLSSVARIQRGRSYKGSELSEDDGLPFINLKCIDRDGGFRRSGIKRFQGPSKTSHHVSPGDIVVAVTDMTQERRVVARAGRVPRLDHPHGVFSMDLVRIDPIDPSDRLWLYGFLRYSGMADEVKQHANGANVLHLHPDRILSYETWLPPPELRTRYGAFADPLWECCESLADSNERLRAARDLLLPKLLSGELSVDRIPDPAAVAP